MKPVGKSICYSNQALYAHVFQLDVFIKKNLDYSVESQGSIFKQNVVVGLQMEEFEAVN